MIIRNWIEFMKKHTALFIILLISQIFSLVCIFFVFGVFQNNLYELVDNSDTKSLEASLEKSDIDADKINHIFRTMVEEGISFDYCYVGATSRDGKIEYLDRAQFKDGKYGYSETVFESMKYGMTGLYYGNEDYINKNKVVVTNPEIEEGIGGSLTLDGETYQIVGVNTINDAGELEIPFTSFPKNCVWDRLSFGLSQLPTREEYETFHDLLTSYGCETNEFYVANNQDLRQEYSMLVVSAVLALLAGGNMYMIYSYIFRKRRKKISVFILCGCSKKQARFLFFSEIVCNMICVVIVATAVFRILLYPVMLSWFRYAARLYGIKEYSVIISIFLFVTLFLGYLLSYSITRKSVLEFRRGDS